MCLLSLLIFELYWTILQIQHIDTLTREILSVIINNLTQYDYVAPKYVSMFRVKTRYKFEFPWWRYRMNHFPRY